MTDPFEPTGYEIDFSDYELPPTPGPFAKDYPVTEWQLRDGQLSGSDSDGEHDE